MITTYITSSCTILLPNQPLFAAASAIVCISNRSRRRRCSLISNCLLVLFPSLCGKFRYCWRHRCLRRDLRFGFTSEISVLSTTSPISFWCLARNWYYLGIEATWSIYIWKSLARDDDDVGNCWGELWLHLHVVVKSLGQHHQVIWQADQSFRRSLYVVTCA